MTPSGAVWSGSTLFAQTCLSENLGLLQYLVEEWPTSVNAHDLKEIQSHTLGEIISNSPVKDDFFLHNLKPLKSPLKFDYNIKLEYFLKRHKTVKMVVITISIIVYHMMTSRLRVYIYNNIMH